VSDPAPLRGVLESVGAPPATLEAWLAATLRDGFALTAAGGYADFETLAAGALDELLRDLAPAAGAAERDAVLKAFGELGVHDDIRPGLEAARAAGIPVSTLSNGSTDYAESLLRRAGLTDLVAENFSVAEVGRWKPAPEPYRHAAERSRLPLEEVALVAVHPWDVEGARRAGARAGWVNRAGGPFPDSLPNPRVEGRDLAAVVVGLLGLT
jgi:2-haloacid dehalogenase